MSAVEKVGSQTSSWDVSAPSLSSERLCLLKRLIIRAIQDSRFRINSGFRNLQ